MFIGTVILGWISMAFMFKRTEKMKEVGLIDTDLQSLTFSFSLYPLFPSRLSTPIFSEAQKFQKVLSIKQLCRPYSVQSAVVCEPLCLYFGKRLLNMEELLWNKKIQFCIYCAAFVKPLYLFEKQFLLPHETEVCQPPTLPTLPGR